MYRLRPTIIIIRFIFEALASDPRGENANLESTESGGEGVLGEREKSYVITYLRHADTRELELRSSNKGLTSPLTVS